MWYVLINRVMSMLPILKEVTLHGLMLDLPVKMLKKLLANFTLEDLLCINYQTSIINYQLSLFCLNFWNFCIIMQLLNSDKNEVDHHLHHNYITCLKMYQNRANNSTWWTIKRLWLEVGLNEAPTTL